MTLICIIIVVAVVTVWHQDVQKWNIVLITSEQNSVWYTQFSCEASLTGQGTTMTLLFWTNSVVHVPPMTLCSKVLTNILLSSLKGWCKSKEGKNHWTNEVSWMTLKSFTLNPYSHYTWPM